MFSLMQLLKNLFISMTVAQVFSTSISHSLPLNLDEPWESFKKTFSKGYRSSDEEAGRRKIFEDNVKLIAKHNLEANMGKHTYTLGINQFTDLTSEEYGHLGQIFEAGDGLNARSFSGSVIPEKTPVTLDAQTLLDYRTQGMVNPVQDEGLCSCSYAFAALGAVEAQYKRKTGQLVQLSVQNVIDCSTDQGNMDCHNGSAINTYQYIMKSGGVDTAQAYPYTSIKAQCKFTPIGSLAGITGYVQVAPNVDGIMGALTTVGPITVFINAAHYSFQSYKSGIYDDSACDNTKFTRALLLVGHGIDGNKSFWILRNSQGTSWGESGYIRMIKGKDICGVLERATYPVIS